VVRTGSLKTRTAVFATIASAALALPGCYGKQMVKGPIYTERVYEKVDTLLAEQESTQRTIQDLRNQLEQEREERVRYEAQMGLALKELEESVRILTSQIEDRLQLLAGGAGTGKSYPLPIPKTTGPADSVSADTTAALSGESEEELYRTSYMDLTRSNYALAIQGFKNYLVRYPSGPHLPEVHYYLGESYYARGRHLEAVSEFQYVIRVFPQSRLVPSAYLKSGMSYLALEERNLAIRSFRELLDEYPDSEEANQAREELDKLQG
jgi:tol-pal system protein YbgF